MRDILSKYIKGSQFVVFCVFVPLLWLGFAYEYSYFKQLGLESNDYLGARHYFYAGASQIIPFFLILFFCGSIRRFFSNDIHKDISRDMVDAVKKTGFKSNINFFRFTIIFTFAFWVLSFVCFSKDWLPGMMGVTWWLVLWNLMAFFSALLTGEKHTHLTLTIVFVIAITITLSASGILYARHALHADAKPFRNDYVLIERDGDKFKVSTKSLSIPIPYVDKLLDMVFGKGYSAH